MEEKKVEEKKEEVKVQPVEEKKADAVSKPEGKDAAEVKKDQKKPVTKAPTATPDKKQAPKATTGTPKNVSAPSVAKPSAPPAPLVINQANLTAFEKDRELFEKLQAIQQQIEQERIRRSQIEVDLQSVTSQLVSVISKFENRNHAKDRLVNSIHKQRAKVVKT